MKRVIWDEPERVGAWVAQRVAATTFGPFTAIGLEEEGELIAGIVYNMFTGPSINMHVALAPGKRFLTREHLAIAFGYPFNQLKCNRITGRVHAGNKLAQRFDEHLGFIREGVERQGAADGADILLYGMLRSECRWLGEQNEPV